MQNEEQFQDQDEDGKYVDSSTISINNEQPAPIPSLSYYQMTSQWIKETGQLAYEGINAYTAMQLLGLWSAATFAVAAATENEHNEAYNNTALVAGAFAIVGGTYTILRNEAYRLRLSDRTVKIERGVVINTNEIRRIIENRRDDSDENRNVQNANILRESK